MKIKHNKKRNTAFVYEALLREATVSAMRKDTKTRNTALNLIKKHFKNGSLLRRDLECYTSLYENQKLTTKTSEKIIREAKIAQRLIDPDGLFKKQTRLIDDVNKELTPSIFNNYVPNYKTLASISQIFSGKMSPKKSIVLESQIIVNMCANNATDEKAKDVDGVIISTFINKFNEKYAGDLLDEQKELLSYYISSFLDNSVELKTFLNEEIQRLKTKVHSAAQMEDFENDSEMSSKAKQIVEKLDSFSEVNIDDEVLLTVMKTQRLVREIYNNVDSN
jgi:hypothetical protein